MTVRRETDVMVTVASHSGTEMDAASAGRLTCELSGLPRHADLVLPDVDLHGSEQAADPGQGFDRLEQLPVRLLTASGQVLPFPERHPAPELAGVLGIGIGYRHPTQR